MSKLVQPSLMAEVTGRKSFRIAIVPERVADQVNAVALAQRLGVPVLPVASEPSRITTYAAVLLASESALSLQQTGAGAPGPVIVDFNAGAMRHRRRGGQNELLGRAVGVGKKADLQILDATAGLGRDSFVLADLHCRVLMCERNLVIGALLAAGLAAPQESRSLQDVLARMSLYQGDARALQTEQLRRIDVIYLDPMFPSRRKSAAVKKEMALFQQLLAANEAPDDSDVLLQWALEQEVSRVVVKRPLKAEPLCGCEPSHSIAGKAVRFDAYVQRALG